MAIGLATALNIDLRTAMRYTALAQQGEMTMLQRYIPALRMTKDATQKLAIVQRTANAGWQQAKEEAKTLGGQLGQMKNALGDAGEKLGELFVPLAKEAIGALRGLAQWMQSLSPQIKNFIAGMASAAVKVGLAIIAVHGLIAAIRLLIAHPLVALVTLLGAALMYFSTLAPEIDKTTQKLEKQRHELMARVKQDRDLLAQMEEVSRRTRRTADEQDWLNEAARQLAKTYGDLNLVVRRHGDVLHIAAGAYDRLRAAQRKQVEAALVTEEQLLTQQAQEIDRQLEEWKNRMKGWGDWAMALGEAFGGTWSRHLNELQAQSDRIARQRRDVHNMLIRLREGKPLEEIGGEMPGPPERAAAAKPRARQMEYAQFARYIQSQIAEHGKDWARDQARFQTRDATVTAAKELKKLNMQVLRLGAAYAGAGAAFAIVPMRPLGD
jgi:hypothetical protein